MMISIFLLIKTWKQQKDCVYSILDSHNFKKINKLLFYNKLVI